MNPQIEYTIDRAFDKVNAEMNKYGITTEDCEFLPKESPTLWAMIKEIEDTLMGDDSLERVQDQCDKYVEAHRRIFARRKAQKELSAP